MKKILKKFQKKILKKRNNFRFFLDYFAKAYMIRKNFYDSFSQNLRMAF